MEDCLSVKVILTCNHGYMALNEENYKHCQFCVTTLLRAFLARVITIATD